MSGNRSDLGNEYLSLMLVRKYEFSKIQFILIKLLFAGLYIYSTYNLPILLLVHKSFRPPLFYFSFFLAPQPPTLIIYNQYKLTMQIQATSRQQLELKQLLLQNERLHAKKSQQLFAKLEAATKDQGDVDFLQNIHLSHTLAFLKRIVAAKKLEAGTAIHQQQQIQKQVLMEYNSQSSSLVEQIEQLKREIEEIRGRKDRYLLGQRHASSRISELEEKLGNEMLDLKKQNALFLKKRMDPCLSFGYSKQLDGTFKLKRSYKNIVHHFLKRIQQNQEILNNLQNSVKDRVKQSETIRAKINKCKSLSRYFENTNDSVDELKKKCQSSKEQLRQRVEAANEEVNKRLPQEIDKKIKQIQDTKKTYECAFYALVQIANKVVQNADLSRVTDYINRS